MFAENQWLENAFPTETPKWSMYGIFTYIYHKNQPNVGKYTHMDPMGTDIVPF